MKIYLHKAIGCPPQWWVNFTCSDDKPHTYNRDTLNEFLKPYKCCYYPETDAYMEDDYIEFDTEQDYAIFLLRWS